MKNKKRIFIKANLKQKIFEYPSNKKISLFEYYKNIYRQIPKKRNEIYISAPFTSGGAFRLYKEKNAGNKKEIFKINGAIATKLAKETSKLYSSDKQLTLMLGSMKDWKQTDYNLFCLFYLAGIKPYVAKRIYENLIIKKHINLDIFNDYSLSKVIKLKEYIKIVNFINKEIKSGCEYRPVKEVIAFPDYKTSLGCTAEILLAKELKIKVKEVVFDENYVDFKKSIYFNKHWKNIKDKDFIVPKIKAKGKTLVHLIPVK